MQSNLSITRRGSEVSLVIRCADDYCAIALYERLIAEAAKGWVRVTLSTPRAATRAANEAGARRRDEGSS